MLEESGYIDMWRRDTSAQADGRVENLRELIAAMAEFESLEAFLEHVALVMETDQEAGTSRVSIMTLHAAKGLEFDAVFLPGWEEGLLPNQRALDEGGMKSLEEERRLAHVGLTRARRRAFVLFAANRRVYNQWQSCLPSRFIDELPPDAVEVISESGIYDRSRSFDADAPSRPFTQAPHAAAARGRFAGERLPAGTTWQVKKRSGDADGFSVGDRVFHDKFGYGHVQSVENDRLEVAFDKAGMKKVMGGFVEKA